MGRRRGGSVSSFDRLARDAAREARRAAQAQRRLEIEAARRARAYQQASKERRQQQVDAQNAQIEIELGQLAGILDATLKVDDTISFESLKLDPTYAEFEPPAKLTAAERRPTEAEFTGTVHTPGYLRWIGWFARKHEERVEVARQAYAEALRQWERGEHKRLDALHAAQTDHEKAAHTHVQQTNKHNQEVEQFRKGYEAAKPEALLAYNTMVLERSMYPDPIQPDFALSFLADAGELTIDYQLPRKVCVPAVAEYRYIKSKDEVEEKPIKPAQLRSLYQDVLVSICLRSIHEVFEADQHAHLRSVVFNGFVSDVNPATGQDSEFCLVSVRARREAFKSINLRRIEKLACLKELGGQISNRPDELIGVAEVVPYGAAGGTLEAVETPKSKPKKAKARKA